MKIKEFSNDLYLEHRLKVALERKINRSYKVQMVCLQIVCALIMGAVFGAFFYMGF